MIAEEVLDAVDRQIEARRFQAELAARQPIDPNHTYVRQPVVRQPEAVGRPMMECGHTCRECAIPTHTKRMRDVASAVAAYYELLDFGDRDQVSSRARAVAAWLLCEQFSRARLSTIANVLGYKDRTGVGHAITRIEGLMAGDLNLRHDITTLRSLVAA